MGRKRAGRSVVDSVVYTFPEPVIALAGAFTITQDTDAPSGEQSSSVPTLTWTAISPAEDGSSTRWSVTFSGSDVEGGIFGKSIENGVYQISVTGSNIIWALSGLAIAPGRVQTDIFYRLFGDTSGLRAVGIGDYDLMEEDYGTVYGALDPFGGGNPVGIASYDDLIDDFGLAYGGFTPTV